MSFISQEPWIGKCIQDSMNCLARLQDLKPAIAQAIDLLNRTLRHGNKVLTAGNGGSGAEAMHMAEELIGRFRDDRRSLPGVALNADGTTLTCIGNDYGFDFVFSRQVEGLGCPDDLLVLFSTSGHARNLMRAVEEARRRDLRILSILGRDGGELAGKSDLEIIVPGRATERIQEAHQLLLHILLEGVERFFGPSGSNDSES